MTADLHALTEALKAAWRRSDQLFALLPPAALHERPIGQRHPFLFYLGHLPAFAWNQLGRGVLGRPPLDPRLDRLFERGIDPPDPSAAPALSAWPSLTAVLDYRDAARDAVQGQIPELRRALHDRPDDPLLQRARVLHLVLEHELMHHETLLYMFAQREGRAHATLQSAGVAPAGARAILRSGGKLTLRAPIAGTVTEVAGVLGGNYDPTSGPLARILAPSPARIEARFTRLPPVDARFELRLDDRPPIPLRVIREAPTIDGRDAALPIWFEPEQGQSLRPGTIGQVVALLGDTDGVVSLPPRAVTLDGGRAFVVSQGRGPIAVHVLASAPEGILLRAAEPPQLRPGEAFAADAAALLRPGQGDEH
jgi:hypothetical protein